MIFSLIHKLENYELFVKEPRFYRVFMFLFMLVEKILVHNWKNNTLLSSFFVMNHETFLRAVDFAKSKTNLVILMYPDKI